eukprot:302141-Chlamydomonas_euryale.AAC.1
MEGTATAALSSKHAGTRGGVHTNVDDVQRLASLEGEGGPRKCKGCGRSVACKGVAELSGLNVWEGCQAGTCGTAPAHMGVRAAVWRFAFVGDPDLSQRHSHLP